MKKIFSMSFLCLIVLCFPVNANTILNAQRILTQLGFKPGPIDGAYGTKTKGALDEFYTSIGKNYDGLLDANELIELQKAFNDSGLGNTCNTNIQTEKLRAFPRNTWIPILILTFLCQQLLTYQDTKGKQMEL